MNFTCGLPVNSYKHDFVFTSWVAARTHFYIFQFVIRFHMHKCCLINVTLLLSLISVELKEYNSLKIKHIILFLAQKESGVNTEYRPNCK